MNKKNILIVSFTLMIIPAIMYFVDVVPSIENEKNVEFTQTEIEKNQAELFVQSGEFFDILIDPNDIVIVNNENTVLPKEFSFKKGLEEIYEQITVYELKQKPVVILPVFTNSAYNPNGFYDYFSGECTKECLTVQVEHDNFDGRSSSNGIKILKLLGYEMISEIKIHKNPKILEKYDKIILLHNEYVTKEIFDAVDLHPNVVYLYPNALYAEIEYDEQTDEITLVRGHAYPDSSIDNGFDWEFDNTRPYEYDIECANWEFWEIDNGHMLNCYPEYLIFQNVEFLKFLKNI